MLKITIREFSRNMKDISERVAQGEGFLVTKNSKVIFEIKPKIKEEKKKMPIVANKNEVLKALQAQVNEKIDEIKILNQHISDLIENN